MSSERMDGNSFRIRYPDSIVLLLQVEIEEHHIGVYADRKDEHMVRAPHPKSLLHGSLVSPSLGAAIMNGKYVNAVPLYRLEKEFTRYGWRSAVQTWQTDDPSE